MYHINLNNASYYTLNGFNENRTLSLKFETYSEAVKFQKEHNIIGEVRRARMLGTTKKTKSCTYDKYLMCQILDNLPDLRTKQNTIILVKK